MDVDYLGASVIILEFCALDPTFWVKLLSCIGVIYLTEVSLFNGSPVVGAFCPLYYVFWGVIVEFAGVWVFPTVILLNVCVVLAFWIFPTFWLECEKEYDGYLLIVSVVVWVVWAGYAIFWGVAWVV